MADEQDNTEENNKNLPPEGAPEEAPIEAAPESPASNEGPPEPPAPEEPVMPSEPPAPEAPVMPPEPEPSAPEEPAPSPEPEVPPAPEEPAPPPEPEVPPAPEEPVMPPEPEPSAPEEPAPPPEVSPEPVEEAPQDVFVDPAQRADDAPNIKDDAVAAAEAAAMAEAMLKKQAATAAAPESEVPPAQQEPPMDTIAEDGEMAEEGEMDGQPENAKMHPAADEDVMEDPDLDLDPDSGKKGKKKKVKKKKVKKEKVKKPTEEAFDGGKKKGKKKPVLILLLIGILACGYFLFMGDDDAPSGGQVMKMPVKGQIEEASDVDTGDSGPTEEEIQEMEVDEILSQRVEDFEGGMTVNIGPAALKLGSFSDTETPYVVLNVRTITLPELMVDGTTVEVLIDYVLSKNQRDMYDDTSKFESGAVKYLTLDKISEEDAYFSATRNITLLQGVKEEYLVGIKGKVIFKIPTDSGFVKREYPFVLGQEYKGTK